MISGTIIARTIIARTCFALACLALICLALAFVSLTSPAQAEAPAIPGTPPLKAAEIAKLLDGKTFNFTGYDALLTAHTSWNLAAKTVSGDYLYLGSPGTFSATWTIRGDKSCTQAKGKDVVCQTIYAYQNGFMEVNPDGSVHGVSIPK